MAVQQRGAARGGAPANRKKESFGISPDRSHIVLATWEQARGRRCVTTGDGKYPAMLGIGPGIEQNTHKVGECVDARELQYAIALLARFPSVFGATTWRLAEPDIRQFPSQNGLYYCHIPGARPMRTPKRFERRTSRVTQARLARVFWNGRSQAVRLPKEFRFSSSEVTVRREGKRIILEPLDLERDAQGWPKAWWSLAGAAPDLELGDRHASHERDIIFKTRS